MYHCSRCDRWFNDDHAWTQHRDKSPRHFMCWTCNRDFVSHDARRQHWSNASGHHYCIDCDEIFVDHEDFMEHIDDVHWYCSACKEFFDDEEELEEHNEDRHWYCSACKEFFDDEEELEEHNEDHHWYCPKCKEFFVNEYGLQEHYRQSSKHHYCKPCDRHFKSKANLQAHLNSSTHKSKDFACPLRGCKQKFISTSALALHMESGACVSGITRTLINKHVQEWDRDTRYITDPSRLLTYNETKYVAGPRSWNGTSYECYLCNRKFGTLDRLNQHLASPRHLDGIYVCPLSTCKTKFKTLSGLLQHIESESCGITRFKTVRDAMDNLVRSVKQIKIS